MFKQKSHLKLMGMLYASGVIVFLLLLLSGELDSLGVGFSILFILIFGYKAYVCFKTMKQTDEQEELKTAYGPPENASAEEKISYYKKALWVGVPAFAILSAWTWYDLRSFESGAEETVSVWAPVSFLYDTGGFWLAALALPVLGVAVFIVLQLAIRKLRRTP